jgi:hypothetical protein
MATFDVLLPVKNCKAYLRESLDSIRTQTFRDWRMFVLDHASSDGSLELAQTYEEKDSRIIVRSFPEARGLSALLNCGIDLCDGKYLLRQDADDISKPNRMDVLLDAFQSDPELVLAGSLGDIIDGRGRRIGNIDMPKGRGGVAASAFYRIPVLHPSAAIRLDQIHRLGARYGEDFLKAVPQAQRLDVPALAEDYFLFGQLAMTAQCRNIEQSLIKFRWHGANISETKSMEQLQIALDISRYLANSFSIMHGVAHFDPAPFCNHGERLIQIDGQSNFRDQFERMQSILLKVMPNSSELKRELSFRKAVASRASLTMAARYCEHAVRYGVSRTESRTVKSWLLRRQRKQRFLTLASSTVSP